ncbi:DUF2877 domain-containing protein [Fusibacter sp. 3D3]|uniref:DUF2877 domain-containing protein n=1 Tax=Fusibacter sp. 3D3 TaxID=1048380 RepID=UPI000853EC38|nr:DUF2877 domain-containing protein [Fusibacter sp. 3D3]GAU77092.1 hypothetical protein F3D3_1691 [Fusibacter sp. 3D3]
MEAQLLSRDLKAYLESCRKSEGKIHSVFKDALNIQTANGELISILTAGKDIEPMSALISAQPREMKGFYQDDPVELSSKGILFKNNNKWLSIEKSKVWHPEISIQGERHSIEAQKRCVEDIKQKLVEEDLTIGLSPLIHYLTFNEGVQLLNKDSPALNEYCDFIQIRLYQLLKALNDRHYDEALTLMPNFVGFGPGLTPSSDDLLAGILVSLVYEESMKEASLREDQVLVFSKDVYEICVGKTTSVSEQMLKFASRGMVSEGYRNLIRSIFFKDQVPMHLRIETVLKHGASSGSDFLFGVYCMNSIRLNRLKPIEPIPVKECEE